MWGRRQAVRRVLGPHRKCASVQTEEGPGVQGVGGESVGQVWVPEVIRRGLAGGVKADVGVWSDSGEEAAVGVGRRGGDGGAEMGSARGVEAGGELLEVGGEGGREERAGQRRRRRQAEARERDFQEADGPLHVSRVLEREEVIEDAVVAFASGVPASSSSVVTPDAALMHVKEEEEEEEREVREEGEQQQRRSKKQEGVPVGVVGVPGVVGGPGPCGGDGGKESEEEEAAMGQGELLEKIAYYENMAREMQMEKGVREDKGERHASRRRRRRGSDVGAADGSLDGMEDQMERGAGLRVAGLWESFSVREAQKQEDETVAEEGGGTADHLVSDETEAGKQTGEGVTGLGEDVKEETCAGQMGQVESDACDARAPQGGEGAGRERMEETLRKVQETAEESRTREARTLHLLRQVQERERDIETATSRLRSSLHTLVPPDPSACDTAQGLLAVVDDIEAYLERLRIQSKTTATKAATRRLQQQLAGVESAAFTHLAYRPPASIPGDVDKRGDVNEKGSGGVGDVGCGGGQAVVEELGDENLESWMKLLSRALLDVGADAVKGTGHMVTDLEEWEVESLGSDVGEGVAESVLLP